MSNIKTPPGILSFPTFFEARPVTQGGEPRFSGSLIFDQKAQAHPAYKALVQAVRDTALEFFKGKPPVGWRDPIRDAAEKADKYAGYEEGCTYIGAWTRSRPGLVGPNLEELLSPDEVWAGQLARFSVKPFGYNNTGNKGVGFLLANVQILKTDMPRLDGRVAASADFNDGFDTGAGDTPF